MILSHPEYRDRIDEWFKWRLAYEGGFHFRNRYLKRFSNRESDDDVTIREQITPVPRFAGAAVDEVKNSIYQRLVDINRDGGSKSYRSCIDGSNGGVDLLGSSMTFFIGKSILPEL